ncbi:SapC family protein [Sphingosinicella ginsenosidimutans]|jgi:hypothetical protein|uniref:SapC family protein n=1 Tax=Allosphingosinicella ginsenosidimutans TaxID=1176539 RepID=A0A5C6TPQ5_9SPHN|nr:SapC family protein [Sphingosinicella ginsenosidimutans]TXC62502.1 SapC family protein [Sphingosinicella ginsenosidimutans]
MATQPPASMPVLYTRLEPLSSTMHANFKHRALETAPHLVKINAVPLTIDEFAVTQRFMPIVFAASQVPVPIALMGLNEGVNVFVDDDGKPYAPFYVPAYVRRFPYLLARMNPDNQELTLCFDAESGLVAPSEEGDPLFEDGKPTEGLNNILKFCEEFEVAANRTEQFARELLDLDLLIDGEVAIDPPGARQPFIYRGFRMVDEQKFRDLPGDKLRKMSESGMLPLIVAHLFSLGLMREIFTRQVDQGKVPNFAENMAPAAA